MKYKIVEEIVKIGENLLRKMDSDAMQYRLENGGDLPLRDKNDYYEKAVGQGQ